MTALETVVINETGTTLMLTEVKPGFIGDVTTLQAKTGKHTITCNNNATYSKYWTGTVLGGYSTGREESVFTITSDDCREYETIYIRNNLANPSSLRRHLVKRSVKETAVKAILNRSKGILKDLVKRMFKGELKPVEVPEPTKRCEPAELELAESVEMHENYEEMENSGPSEIGEIKTKDGELSGREYEPTKRCEPVELPELAESTEMHENYEENFKEMENSGPSEIGEIKTKDGELSSREFEGVEGTPSSSSPRQFQSSTEFVNSVRDAFELKSDAEFIREMKEEIGKLDYITNLLNPDYDGRKTQETSGTCILFYFNGDYKLEFYFTTYQGMGRIIGVGLKHAKVILEKGRLLYVQEISREDWQDALNNFDSTSSSMKVLVPQSPTTFIPNGSTLLFDLAKYFILRTVIASFHPNVATYPNIVGGANFSVESTNQNTPSSSSGSDSSRLQTLIEIVKNLWNGGFLNALTTKIQGTISGSQKATTVFVRLLPGGELLNGEESFSSESIGDHLSLSQDGDVQELTSQLVDTILIDLEFSFIVDDNDIKKIQVDVGPICFELDEEKGKDNFKATKRFGWSHRLMDASFQVADETLAYLSSEHMPLEIKEVKQTTIRSSTDETGSGTTYSGSLKVEGSVPQFGKITGQGDIASSSSRSLSQTSSASGERIIMETNRVFSITSQFQHSKAKLKYTYTSENDFLLVCLLDSLRKSRIQSEDINQGRLPSYFWNGTFGTHFDCLSQYVKFRGTWVPRNQSESVKYTLEATREVEMTEKVELSKMIKARSESKLKSMFSKFRKSPAGNPNNPMRYKQHLQRDLYLNHAMTHLSGLSYKLEEKVNEGQLGEEEPKTILKKFASGGTPNAVVVDLVDVNPKMQQQLVQDGSADIEAGSGLP